MRCMKCLKCGYIAEDIEFMMDYGFGDELSIYGCPECGNPEEDEIVEEK